MMFETDKVAIFVLELLKQTCPGHLLETMVLSKYPDQVTCVVSNLEQYIEKTTDLRKDQNLLTSFVKPHKRITTSTISRWWVAALKNAGVNMPVFESHSPGSASTAHPRRKGISMKEINKAAGWSSSKMFAQHYNKLIVDESGNFSMTVLESRVVSKFIIRVVIFIKNNGVNTCRLSLY